MSTYSTTTAAARLSHLHISPSTVRNYASDPRIQPLLSADAHPDKGKQRIFCDGDLSVIASIYQQQKQGISIADAVARTQAGVLLETPTDTYRQPPEDDAQPTIDATGAPQEEEPTTDTAPPSALVVRAVYEVLEAREREMWERVNAAERRADAAEAIIAELRRELEEAHKPWWRRLIGAR